MMAQVSTNSTRSIQPMDGNRAASQIPQGSPICGDCIHYVASPTREGFGFCPVSLHINEWQELEIGKPIALGDTACSKYELNCPF
jgi:hypothetical protein